MQYKKLMCTSWSLNITVNPFLGKRLEAMMCYLPKLLDCFWKHSIEFFSDADTSRNLLIDLSKHSTDHFDIFFFILKASETFEIIQRERSNQQMSPDCVHEVRLLFWLIRFRWVLSILYPVVMPILSFEYVAFVSFLAMCSSLNIIM